jgi:hypothetical protein
LSTSAVAVCCCSDSLRSRLLACSSVKSRTFLDRDDGLVGERAEQIDLTIREGACCLTGNPDDADGAALVDHRHGDGSSQSDPTIKLAH